MTDTFLFAGFALAYAVLLTWGVTLAVRAGRVVPSDVAVLVVAALVYDNTVLSAGRFIGEGAVLEGLNLARYWTHAFLTPLLVVFAWHATARSGLRWARSRVAAVLTGLVVVALVALEIVTVLSELMIRPEWEFGVLSYGDTSSEGPPLMVLVVALSLIVSGLLVWRRTRWPWLLVGAGVMTLGSAVPVRIDSGAATNAFELILLTSIMATKHHQDRAASATRARSVA